METIVRLAPDVRLLLEGGVVALVGEAALLEMPAGGGRQLEPALRALQNGVSLNWLLEHVDHSVIVELLKQLFELRWLHFVAEDASQVPQRYEQVVRWLSSVTARPNAALARMLSGRVAILGVGGLGVQVLEHLVGLGLHSVVLVDSDVVEASNLNRQYGFTPQDVGMPKAIVAADRVRNQVPTANIHAIVRHVHSESDLSELDAYAVELLINCADQPAHIEDIVRSYAKPRGLATITGGVGLHRGFWGPLVPDGDTKSEPRSTYVTIGRHKVPRVRCTASHGPYNSIVASLMAHDAFSYMSGCMRPRSLGQRMTIDFMTLQVGTVDEI